jgi:hypothetical protein
VQRAPPPLGIAPVTRKERIDRAAIWLDPHIAQVVSVADLAAGQRLDDRPGEVSLVREAPYERQAGAGREYVLPDGLRGADIRVQVGLLDRLGSGEILVVHPFRPTPEAIVVGAFVSLASLGGRYLVLAWTEPTFTVSSDRIAAAALPASHLMAVGSARMDASANLPNAQAMPAVGVSR